MKNYDLESELKYISHPPEVGFCQDILPQQQKCNRAAPVIGREQSFQLSAREPSLIMRKGNNAQTLPKVLATTRIQPWKLRQTAESKMTGLKAMWGPGTEKQMLGTNYINLNIAQAFVNIVCQH